jgi:hypothetical protein
LDRLRSQCPAPAKDGRVAAAVWRRINDQIGRQPSPPRFARPTRHRGMLVQPMRPAQAGVGPMTETCRQCARHLSVQNPRKSSTELTYIPTGIVCNFK